MDCGHNQFNGPDHWTTLHMDPLRSHPPQPMQNAQQLPESPTPIRRQLDTQSTACPQLQPATPLQEGDQLDPQDQWSWPVTQNSRPPIYSQQPPIYNAQAPEQPAVEPSPQGPPDLFAQTRMLHPDLELRCPRIPVTPSMLQAYALMRGTNVPHTFDPLHQALYPGRNRILFPHRLYLPSMSHERIPGELPKGTTFFWDPVVPVPANELPLLAPNFQGYAQNYARALSLTYEEFVKQNAPTVGNNHFKGDQVYENFGYYRAGDKWVDPESEGSLYDAYMNHARHKGSVPDFQRSQKTGPLVMARAAEDELYKVYVDAVTDDTDGEGDPRMFRIDPPTFARWASGAALGDRYEETPLEPILRSQTKLPLLRKPKGQVTRIRKRVTLPQFQFDMETGSILSGFYEPGSDPSLLESAQGVDILRPPLNLCYSCPQDKIEIEEQAFGAAWRDSRKQGSIASTPELFHGENNLEKAYKHLGIPGDLASGKKEYEEAEKHILTVRAQHDAAHNRTYRLFEEAIHAAEKQIELQREIVFLERRDPDFSTLFTEVATPPETKRNKDSETDANDKATKPPDEKQKRQYRRFFEETLQRENINLAKTRMQEARMEGDLKEMQRNIVGLEKRKNELLKQRGVQSVDEIPDLIPFRKPELQDLRKEFKSDHDH